MGLGVQTQVLEFSEQANHGCTVSQTLKTALRNLPAVLWPADFPKGAAGPGALSKALAHCSTVSPPIFTAEPVSANQSASGRWGTGGNNTRLSQICRIHPAKWCSGGEGPETKIRQKAKEIWKARCGKDEAAKRSWYRMVGILHLSPRQPICSTPKAALGGNILL